MGLYIKGICYEDLLFRADDNLARWLMEQDIVFVDKPHGRLVDENEIHKGIRMDKNAEYRYFIDKVDAPTVIEAEG